MRRLHPEALWITYPNSGHVPMEESAAAFNADLLAFLAQALGEEAVNNG
jgi:pimeloyl-ACP methyl ester carboxylesterase